MSTKPRALILTGYGINCDRETEFAFNQAGAEAERVHINDLIAG
ncbi:MAG: phosphoribosylformylglycinamidine synthase subunit PurQ, partial [Proteobacteria bacterium]|nr:phosphoribosylformylglycinamidine synthase subunit PurQ [Pseudomonadota bacterium]